MIEKLTGRKIKLYLPSSTYDVEVNQKKGQEVVEFTNEQESLDVQRSNFTAQGYVKTKDGREISFSAKFEQFKLEYSYSKTSGKMTDPLVLKLGNNSSEKKLAEMDLEFRWSK